MGAPVDAHWKGITMAKFVSEREVASVRLFTLEISEDEAGTYALCMKYLLENLDAATLERVTGAYRDEVEGMLGDLLAMVDLGEWEEEAPPVLAPAG